MLGAEDPPRRSTTEELRRLATYLAEEDGSALLAGRAKRVELRRREDSELSVHSRAKGLVDLALEWHALGDDSEARRLLEDAWSTWEPESWGHADDWELIADGWRAVGNPDRSASITREVLEQRWAELDKSDLFWFNNGIEVARAWKRVGEANEARRCLEALQQDFGPVHPSDLALLPPVYSELGDEEAARRTLAEAIEAAKREVDQDFDVFGFTALAGELNKAAIDGVDAEHIIELAEQRILSGYTASEWADTLASLVGKDRALAFLDRFESDLIDRMREGHSGGRDSSEDAALLVRAWLDRGERRRAYRLMELAERAEDVSWSSIAEGWRELGEEERAAQADAKAETQNAQGLEGALQEAVLRPLVDQVLARMSKDGAGGQEFLRGGAATISDWELDGYVLKLTRDDGAQMHVTLVDSDAG